MRKWSLGGLVFLAGLLVWGQAPAAAQVSILASPLRAEYQVAPGAGETNVITVKNTGSKPGRLRVYAEDWQLDRKGDVIYSRAGANPRSCAAWLQINPNDFRLEPGQSRQVRYTLTVPPGAREGGYWSAIILESRPVVEGAPIQSRMAVHGRIGVVIYETVGRPEIKAKFQDLQVEAGKRGLTCRLVFANQGLGYFRLKKGRLVLKNSAGQEISQVEIPEVPVLPGGVREVEVKPNLPPGRGDYRAEAVVDVGRRELLGRKQTFTIGN